MQPEVRRAVEYLVSGKNIAACRANGSTVQNVQWVDGQPAWPVDHFLGAPQLRRMMATAVETNSRNPRHFDTIEGRRHSGRTSKSTLKYTT